MQPLTDLLTKPGGTWETTRDTGDAQPGLRLVSETRRNAGDGGDVRRMAHNPEVEGSNPSPRYQGQRPVLEQRTGLLLVVCARICAREPTQAAPSAVLTSMETSAPPMISSASVFAT